MHVVAAPGINNTAWVEDGFLMVGDDKAFGKTDTLVIPLNRIDRMFLNRKGVGKDILTVYVGSDALELKSKTAEELLKEIVESMKSTS